jgi:hypothetical protein
VNVERLKTTGSALGRHLARVEADLRQADRLHAHQTRKDTRSPGRLRGQGLLFETDDQRRFWGVQERKGNK